MKTWRYRTFLIAFLTVSQSFWLYPQKPAKPELIVQTGHANAVLCAAFSPDGKNILSGSYDTTLILWDTTTGKEIRVFRGHSRKINCVAYSPDGKYGLSGSEDKTVRLWDLNTGKEIKKLSDHKEEIFSVAFSSDGKTALSSSWD